MPTRHQAMQSKSLIFLSPRDPSKLDHVKRPFIFIPDVNANVHLFNGPTLEGFLESKIQMKYLLLVIAGSTHFEQLFSILGCVQFEGLWCSGKHCHAGKHRH